MVLCCVCEYNRTSSDNAMCQMCFDAWKCHQCYICKNGTNHGHTMCEMCHHTASQHIVMPHTYQERKNVALLPQCP